MASLEHRTTLIPAIVGPTASGKSELGIAMAVEFGGEVINLDSIQVYRRLELATAKVPLDQRRGVPHHLVDFLEPTDQFTAGEYAELAARTIIQIDSAGKMPIFVGGTGFYLKALVNPLFRSPKTDSALRRRLGRVLTAHGPGHLHRMLSRVDPRSAAAISPGNWSRSIRALEFYFQTGARISDARSDTPSPPEFATRLRVIALNPPRQELYERINLRADSMVARGLIDEVKSLISSGVPSDAKAFRAHGYRRVVEYLDGRRSLDDAINQMKLDTRHYAKRQLTWWRAWANVKWIDGFGSDSASIAEASAHIRAELAAQMSRCGARDSAASQRPPR
ncbi:MAG TPA: tRNA (adenosine(37)-N6)-dimethylallyltransferase MiaA [Blastocatellia bacterium]|nr:tRNA (adenosine(37)-N6)-dimethylallyltransferase MiaA [Blastocatellia bacterium]